MIRPLLMFAAALALGGCATAAPKVVTKEVLVPVAKACVPPELAAPDHYADEDLASTADPVERLKKVGAANQQRKARLAAVEPVVAACR